MRKLIAVSAALLMTGCASNTADLAGANSDWTRQSGKKPIEVAGCISDAWGQNTSRISSLPKPGGFTLVLMGGPPELPVTDAVVTVVESAAGSTVQYGGRLRGIALPWVEGSVTRCI